MELNSYSYGVNSARDQDSVEIPDLPGELIVETEFLSSQLQAPAFHVHLHREVCTLSIGSFLAISFQASSLMVSGCGSRSGGVCDVTPWGLAPRTQESQRGPGCLLSCVLVISRLQVQAQVFLE